MEFRPKYLRIANLAFPAPTKPKLVARVAGNETSPWKVRKDAPKISAKDVPGALRPLMSCALWRLHESIERNDPDQLFLLSDQTEIQSVAQKLNIIVQSCKEAGATIASKFSRTGLDIFGDLERDFGMQQRIAISPTHDANEANGEHNVPDNANGDLPKDEDAMNKSVFSEGTTNTEISSIVREQDLENHSSEHEEEKILANGERYEDHVTEQDMAETAASFAAVEGSKKAAKSVESIKSLVDSIIQQDLQKNLGGSVNGLNIDDVKGQMNMADEPALENPGIGSPRKTPLPQPQNIEPVQSLQEVQTVNKASSSKHTTTTSTSILEAEQEPEDSDEEVVVFIPQPKRLSAQQKPAHQSSRPSTPKEQTQQKPVGQSPQKSLVKPHTKGKAARHSPNQSVIGHAHPQAANSPTIIDPDAFGRDSRVNLNPNPRLPHNASGNPNHRNRGNMQNPQGGQMPRNSPRQHARTSPPRNSPQENSRRHIPIPAPASKGTPNHRRQASRTSPRRDPTPKAEGVTPTSIESQAMTATVSSESQLPDYQLVETMEFVPQTALSGRTSPHSSAVWKYTDFVPRSALSNAEFKPDDPQPRIYDASEFVPRPSKPVREFKPRAPKPKVFEPAEFVPRDFVPRTTVPRAQSKQYSPEPEFIEPRPSNNDVDYVLKSGSTRASARGRGRLWTPS